MARRRRLSLRSPRARELHKKGCAKKDCFGRSVLRSQPTLPPDYDPTRQPSSHKIDQGRFKRLATKSMLSQSHRNDIGDDGFALSWFQTRALRHAVHDVRPIFAAVTPDHWQRVAFDAAVSEKCATFVQHRKINRLSLSRGRHLRSDRWNVVGQLATSQHTSQHKKDRRLHLRDQSRKSCALENRLPRTSPLLARGL